MFTATLIVIVILAILLILVVLIQNSKGGLSPTMGSASNQLIGVKRTTDILEKVTWGLAISIMVLCLASNVLLDKPELGDADGDVSTVNIERAPENAVAPAQQAPATTQAADSGQK